MEKVEVAMAEVEKVVVVKAAVAKAVVGRRKGRVRLYLRNVRCPLFAG